MDLPEIKMRAHSYYKSKDDHETSVIMIHGFTGSPYDMRELADFLFEKGADVYAVRLAGHGSRVDDLIQTEYEDWVESVEHVISHLEKKGSKRIYLVGYSFGANIGLDIAARYPGRLAGLVCLGTAIQWRFRAYYFILYHLFRIFGKDRVRKPYVSRFKRAQFESTGNYADFPVKGLGVFRDTIKQVTRQTIPKVTTPVLIIHSRSDRISHPKSSGILFDQIMSQHKEMFILPELNHNPLRSDSKNLIFKRVLKFIEA